MPKYVIVPERSQITLEAKSSLHPIRVETSGLEGYLEATTADGRLDPNVAPKAHVELDAQQLKTGNSLYDRELERKLEMRKYPRVRGDLREVKPLGPGDRYHLRGDLSLHGTTNQIEGDVTVKMVGDKTFEIEGDAVIDMRNFKLDPPKLLMLQVYPEVKIHGRVVAELEE